MKIWPILKKELRLYFTTPVAYGVMFSFLLVMGYFFFQIFSFYTMASMQSAMNPQMGGRDLNVTDSVLRPLFSNMSVILLLLMPLITMRLFAEERRSGTIELLLTYPVRDGAVLLGKFFAAVTLFLVMLLLTLLYPAMIMYFTRVEWGPLLTGYVGLLLMGATFIAVGVCISSFFENQIMAGTVTFMVLLMFWVIGWSADAAGGIWKTILSELSIIEHFDTFAKGIFDTKDVIYYLNFTILALFIGLKSLEARRWKG